jgi:hypothetical protein
MPKHDLCTGKQNSRKLNTDAMEKFRPGIGNSEVKEQGVNTQIEIPFSQLWISYMILLLPLKSSKMLI